MAYSQRLMTGGHWIAGASLQPTATPTTVVERFGAGPTLTGGPYAEIKEQFGGFDVIPRPEHRGVVVLRGPQPVFLS